MQEKIKNAETKAAQKQEKLTYEQLEQVAGNLNQQCQKLYSQLREAQGIINSFNEVDMLLSIIGKGENFNPAFIDRCTLKVEEIITKALDSSEQAEKQEEKEQ